MAQKRFTQSLKESLLTEYGYNILLEDGTQLLKENSYDYSEILRPREGDLLWMPMAGFLYEIKFVENIEELFQLGKLYTYEIKVERYEYSSEVLDTGIDDIDSIEDELSLSTELMSKIILEDGSMLLAEDGEGRFIYEDETVDSIDSGAQNDFIQDSILDDNIIDFTESNPFSSGRIY